MALTACLVLQIALLLLSAATRLDYQIVSLDQDTSSSASPDAHRSHLAVLDPGRIRDLHSG
jgi:hypothetical protein